MWLLSRGIIKSSNWKPPQLYQTFLIIQFNSINTCPSNWFKIRLKQLSLRLRLQSLQSKNKNILVNLTIFPYIFPSNFFFYRLTSRRFKMQKLFSAFLLLTSLPCITHATLESSRYYLSKGPSAIHLRHGHFLEGSRICQIYRRIVVKNCQR